MSKGGYANLARGIIQPVSPKWNTPEREPRPTPIEEMTRGLDKATGNVCPRYGLETLNVYYEEDSDVQLGANCAECGLKGFFMNGKLVQVATV